MCKLLQEPPSHHHRQPQLDPPPLLHDVVVVLVAPKLPVSIGTVARALSSFECPSLRLVQPRCERLTRASRNSSKGAQYLLHNSVIYENLHDALVDCDTSAAFARWGPREGPLCLPGVPSLLQFLDDSQQSTTQATVTLEPMHGVCAIASFFLLHMVFCGLHGQTLKPACISHCCTALSARMCFCPGAGATRRTLALVYGREEAGMLDEEVSECDCVVSIPIGRLQESLSLSHAVSITLSQLYQVRCFLQVMWLQGVAISVRVVYICVWGGGGWNASTNTKV